MTEQAKVPAIRFAGFTDPWEQRKLGELVTTTIGGGTPSTSNPAYWDGEIPWIQSSNVLEDTLFDVDIPKAITQKGLEESAAQIVPENSIAVVTHVGVGKLIYLPFQYSTSQDFISLCGLKGDARYTCYALWKRLQEDLHIVQGSAIKGITKEDLLEKNLPMPSVEEQAQIGVLFSQLDNLITLHQRKYDKLVIFKKSMLEKMFPKDGESVPEIRFAGFTDPWEQRKLIDLVDVLDGDRGKNYPTSDDFDISGHTLFLNASNVTNDGFLFQDNQFITEEKSNSMGNGKLEEDDIVVTSRGSLGHIAWYNADISSFVPYARINSGMLILRNKKEIETEYLYYFMKSSKGQSQISFISFGSAQPQLTKKGVEDLEVILPTRRDEQVQLGHYFSNLDDLITLHQRKLELLRNIKKSLLDKMFV